MRDNQHTLKKKHIFSGKGLHSGKSVRMSVEPAPENFGIKFRRTDLGGHAIIDACVDYVTTTSRGTTLENGEVKISTLEHLMASLYGLHIDNALISIDSQEVPILDGSALPYVTEFISGGIVEQQAERHYFTPKSKILYRDPKSGSELVVMPDDEFNIDLMIDFNSKVLGNQYARLTPATDFASEIAPCRTFVFFHELEPLFRNNLIKGGDLDNAIVIVEHHVDQKELDRLAELFNVQTLERAPEGYLNHLQLRFCNECARHKLLDIMGDFSLIGMPLKARVIGYKTGHGINTGVARVIREEIKKSIKTN